MTSMIFQFRWTIASIHQKFLETDSVQDASRIGRPSSITEDKIQQVQEILEQQSHRSRKSGISEIPKEMLYIQAFSSYSYIPHI